MVRSECPLEANRLHLQSLSSLHSTPENKKVIIKEKRGSTYGKLGGSKAKHHLWIVGSGSGHLHPTQYLLRDPSPHQQTSAPQRLEDLTGLTRSTESSPNLSRSGGDLAKCWVCDCKWEVFQCHWTSMRIPDGRSYDDLGVSTEAAVQPQAERDSQVSNSFWHSLGVYK